MDKFVYVFYTLGFIIGISFLYRIINEEYLKAIPEGIFFVISNMFILYYWLSHEIKEAANERRNKT